VEDKSISKALLAELIGTFVLVFSIIVVISIYAGPIASKTLPNIIVPFIAFGHLVVLFILIQSLGAISGGHFNPAVTLGVLSIKKIRAGAAFAYILVQLAGAVLAGCLAAAVIHKQADFVKFAAPSIDHLQISTGAGIVLEAVFTFLLVWTIVATAVNPDGPKEWAPAAIASALALGVLLIGSLTGASLNPARAFGPDVANALLGTQGGFGSISNFITAYLIAPIAGGVLAATIYNALYIKNAEARPPSPAPSEQSPL
jgi:glycerol uptake facilitator protein